MSIKRLYINSGEAKVEKVKHNGRDHWKVSSATLPFDVVMNKVLYTREQIEAHYSSLDGTLAPMGHPKFNGEYVSAFTPEAINEYHVGAWNTNTRIEDGRVRIDKMVDIEIAKNSEKGRRLLEALEKGDPVSTSVAARLKLNAPTDIQASQGVEFVAEIIAFDHDAILLDEVPAAGINQGVGIFVNTSDAIPLIAHGRDCGTIDNIDKANSLIRSLAQTFRNIFNQQPIDLAVNKEADTMALTPEEKAELIAEINEAVAASMNEKLDAVDERITTLEAVVEELRDKVNSEQEAADEIKREVVKEQMGEVVANQLRGAALNAVYKSLKSSAPLSKGSDGSEIVVNKVDINTYFGE